MQRHRVRPMARANAASLALILLASGTTAQADTLRKTERIQKAITIPRVADVTRHNFVKVDVSHLWHTFDCQKELSARVERRCTQNGESAVFTLQNPIFRIHEEEPVNTTTRWLIRTNSACRLNAMTTAQVGKDFNIDGWDSRGRSEADVKVSITPIPREAAYAYSYSLFATAACPVGVDPKPEAVHPGPE